MGIFVPEANVCSQSQKNTPKQTAFVVIHILIASTQCNLATVGENGRRWGDYMLPRHVWSCLLGNCFHCCGCIRWMAFKVKLYLLSTSSGRSRVQLSIVPSRHLCLIVRNSASDFLKLRLWARSTLVPFFFPNMGAFSLEVDTVVPSLQHFECTCIEQFFQGVITEMEELSITF